MVDSKRADTKGGKHKDDKEQTESAQSAHNWGPSRHQLPLLI
jgi:hypothetical protein